MKPGDRIESEAKAPPGVGAASFVRWVLVAVMAVVAIASVLYARGPSAHDGAGRAPDAHVGSNPAGGSKATRYYCPMHPSIVQDHPGECPICSMTLVLEAAERRRDQPVPRRPRPRRRRDPSPAWRRSISRPSASS